MLSAVASDEADDWDASSGRRGRLRVTSVKRLKDMNPYRQIEVRDRRRRVAVAASVFAAIAVFGGLWFWLAKPRIDDAFDRRSDFHEIVRTVDQSVEIDRDLRCRSAILGICFPSSRDSAQIIRDADTVDRLVEAAERLGYVRDGDSYRRDTARLTIELNDDGTIDLRFRTRWPDTSFILGE